MNNAKFFGNTISNVTGGIYLNGYNGPSGLLDNNTEIGVENGNTITNFSQYGIWSRYCKALIVANNNMTSATYPQSTLYGIYTATVAGSDVYNNTVTITPLGGNQTITAISLGVSFDVTDVGNVYNNTVTGCTNAAATSASFTGITCSGNAATLNFYNNTVSNNVINGTGGFTGMAPGSAVNLNMYNNVVSNNQKTGTATSTSAFNCIQLGGMNNNVYDNLVYSNYNQTATGFSAGTIQWYQL